jgi:hypothetical protein
MVAECKRSSRDSECIKIKVEYVLMCQEAYHSILAHVS